MTGACIFAHTSNTNWTLPDVNMKDHVFNTFGHGHDILFEENTFRCISISISSIAKGSAYDVATLLRRT